MAFRDIAEQIVYPEGVSQRYKTLDALDRILDGRLYEHLRYPFNVEVDASENYIPQQQRRPSIIYNLPKIIVSMTASLTFGKNHAPYLQCADDRGNRSDDAEKLIARLTADAAVWQALLKAVFRGSIGSCALIVRPLPDGRPWVSVVKGRDARPLFNPRNPKDLLGVIQQCPLSGADLVQMGYADIDESQKYWLRIELDDVAETWYQPLTNDDFQRLNAKGRRRTQWVKDPERSYDHGFGVVPAVWCRNLEETERIDGPSTFGDIVDIAVEIDYKFSQIGRGLTFAIDPLLIVQRGELSSLSNELGGTTTIIKDGGTPLQLGAGDDAKLLEAHGQGFTAAMEFVAQIREYALEVVGGMKSDAEHSGGVQSGRALEMLTRALDWLVDRMRSSYGDDGLVPLLRILLTGVKAGVLANPTGVEVSPDTPIQQVWPEKKIPQGAELAQTMNALLGFAGGSAMAPKQMLPDDLVTTIAAMAVGASDPAQIVREMQAAREKAARESVAQEDAMPDSDSTHNSTHDPKTEPKE